MYHIVCPAKYRRAIFTDEVDNELKNICIDIAKRYEIVFLEIGVDRDHVHFLVQSVPMYSPKKIVQIVKSISARELFKRIPTLRKQLWGSELWTDGYFISTVGKHGDENMIKDYVKNQGEEESTYKRLHKQVDNEKEQLSLW